MIHSIFRRSVPAHYSLIGLTLTLSAGSAAVAQADENSGFVEGATATLNLRNAYINRNLVNPAYPNSAAPQNKRRNGHRTSSSTLAPAIPLGR
jgi:hypothetical protein